MVGWEDTPQVGSFLLVSLGPISDVSTFYIRIGITNSRISARVIMTQFQHSLPGWYSMHKKLLNNTSADSCAVLVSRTLLLLMKLLEKKKKKIVKKFFCSILYNFKVYCREVGFCHKYR